MTDLFDHLDDTSLYLHRSGTLADELATKGVLTKEEFQIHTTQRYDKVMKTLNKVTVSIEYYIRLFFALGKDLIDSSSFVYKQLVVSVNQL